MDIHVYLREVVRSKSPDLHLKVGRVPMVRLVTGEMYEMENAEVITAHMVEEVAAQILSQEKMDLFKQHNEVDTAYAAMGVGRFRVNMYMDTDGPAIAFRSIPQEIPTLAELGLPEIVRSFIGKTKGLVLVTGPTGSGKSTTLAAMVNEINLHRRAHIITIEDPIEFLHTSKYSLLTQREVGTHTHSFPQAIRSSLRQDPDVILIGEMRDLETISAAMTLAETGHLVLATLHTQDAAQTVDRIIDVFPPYQQEQVRTQLSSTLIGVLAQRLIPRSDKSGRALAMEILVRNDAVTNCIKEGNTHQLYSMMQVGREDGMLTLDTALANLYKQGLIDMENLMLWARDKELVKNLIS
jgi:twitching motility protein PilT